MAAHSTLPVHRGRCGPGITDDRSTDSVSDSGSQQAYRVFKLSSRASLESLSSSLSPTLAWSLRRASDSLNGTDRAGPSP